MNPVVCERIGDCIQIRLASGPTNVLTADVVRALSNALSEAERDARGVLLCGGEKKRSNNCMGATQVPVRARPGSVC